MSSENTSDLKLCDLEPVQFIGTIQPFGILLVVDRNNYTVQWASQNCATELTRDLSTILGARIDQLLGDSVIEKLQSNQTHLQLENWTATVQHNPEHILINLEPLQQRTTMGRYETVMQANKMIDSLQKSSTLLNLCKSAVNEIQKFTDFDRVMIYQFHEDLHGEVIAEKTQQGVESYLGFHYPATDIPAPARAIFEKNWLRLIPDVSYEPVPIIGLPDSSNSAALASSLDLSTSLLRGVSPIHIEYLKNMKVGASLTISLLREGNLWGLIACHHLKPKLVLPDERAICELIGRVISSLLHSKERQEAAVAKEQRRAVYLALARQVEGLENIEKALLMGSPRLQDLISTSGIALALYLDGRWAITGSAPRPEQLEEIVNWLAKHHKNEEVFYTRSLPSLFPEAHAFKEVACGLLAISLPKSERLFILCFRPEVVQTVTWAGNPEKPLAPDQSDLKLHPRQSFEAWKQSVELHSEAWKPWEIDIAFELRASLLAQDLRAESMKALKAQAQSRTREEVMSILSHDLKNPLTSIQLNISLIFKVAPDQLTAKIKSILENMRHSIVIMTRMIEEILDISRIEAGTLLIENENVSLEELIIEVIEMLLPSARAKSIHISKDLSIEGTQTFCDRGKIFQVLANLISNAIKFTPEHGKIKVNAIKGDSGRVEIQISDTGVGISKENVRHIFNRFWQAKETRRFGAGLGLAISRGIVQAHGGEIWVKSEEGRGSTFCFTLPGYSARQIAA